MCVMDRKQNLIPSREKYQKVAMRISTRKVFNEFLPSQLILFHFSSRDFSSSSFLSVVFEWTSMKIITQHQ